MNDDLFVDTLYLVARLNPKDQWHKAALDIDLTYQRQEHRYNRNSFD